MDDHADKLLDHEYDGIRELDNKLPPWWLNLFYVTIIWGVGYIFYYHIFAIGDLQVAEYYKSIDPNWTATADQTYRPMKMIEPYHSPLYGGGREITPKLLAEQGAQAEGAAAEADQGGPVEYTALTDAEELAKGKDIFTTNCASCHGMAGEGGIGPNLTDDYWIHGNGDINGIVQVIRDGVPAKGMVAWKNFLPPKQILQVGSYVLTLQGTNPPNAKEPQGKKVSGE